MVMKLKVGNVVKLTNETVYASVPEHFLYSNKRGCFDKARGLVDLKNDNFDYLRGEYVVTSTVMDGGGTGHGPHDVYPDGYHVFLKSIDGEHEVDFYQSGCFTAVNENVEVIGEAEISYSWVKV